MTIGESGFLGFITYEPTNPHFLLPRRQKKHPPFFSNNQHQQKKGAFKKNQRINESLKELWVLIEELGKTCDPIKGSFHVASSAAPRMCSEFLFSASPPGGWKICASQLSHGPKNPGKP